MAQEKSKRIVWQFIHNYQQIAFFEAPNELDLAWKIARHLCLARGWRFPAQVKPMLECDESILQEKVPDTADGLILPDPEAVRA